MSSIKSFLLALLKPFYKALASFFPEDIKKIREELKKDPYHSSMVKEFNLWHEWIFRPNFEKVRYDKHEIKKLKALSQKGTLVYVMKNRGQLETSFFNHRFLKDKIPLARFANGCRTLYWRPFKDIFKALIARLDYYYDKGLLEDPLQSSYLQDLIISGESVLLNLKLSREFIFGSSEDAVRFIQPLIEAAQKSEKPVYLITQEFLYGRHPEKSEKSFFDLLFGEKSNPGTFRKLFLFIWSYRRRATVKFGEALNLKDFIEKNSEKNQQELSQEIKNNLLERLHIARKSITGPVLRNPENLLDSILRHSAFKKNLELLAQETGKSRETLEKESRKIFKEIAAEIQYNYIDFYDHLVRWITNKFYDGLDIDTEGLSKIKAVAGKHPVVLVPSHRSHLDYLIISYIFYNYDITMPHVCAGINLKFWPAGHFVKKAGGFFIRRSFQGQKLYKLVLEHYMKALLKEGHCVEFFIEGTRSRTGKLLKPKMGILSMLMQSYLDGSVDDIYFVPVSVNYEKILEQKSYLDESQGSDKSKENAAALIKLRKKFSRNRKKFGKVFIRFAQPHSIKSFFKEKQISPKTKTVDDCRREVEEFAYQMTYQINKVSVVTPSSLIALSLLSFKKKALKENEVIHRAQLLKKYLDFKQAPLSDLLRKNDQWSYKQAFLKFVSDRTVSFHEDFDEGFYTLDPTKRILLDYSKNISIHFFVSLVCLSKILLQSQKQEIAFSDIEKRYEALKTLLRHDFTFSQRSSLREHLLKVIAFYEEQGFCKFNSESDTLTLKPAIKDIQFYALLLDDFFEVSYLTLQYIKYQNFENKELRVLEKSILTAMKPFHLKDDFSYPEALSQFNIHNAILVFKDLGLLSMSEDKKVTRTLDKDSIALWEENLKSLLSLDENSHFHVEKFKSELIASHSEEISDIH